MRRLRQFLFALAGLPVLAVLGVAGWLLVAPPELIRVGAAYSAKMVCSNAFLAGREAQAILADDVQAPGHPLLRIMRVSVDDTARTASAGLLGVFGARSAVYRDGLGCTVLPEGAVPADLADTGFRAPAAVAPDMQAQWPQGEGVTPSDDPALAAILDDAAMTGPGMRGVVVVRDGRIVGERYGEGFGRGTPLLGWSMTKTVTSAIIGILQGEGRMSVTDRGLFPQWAGDGRAEISVADLLGMSSGLAFNEDYGDVTDVTRMLYLEPDMAAFAADKPLAGGVGEVFSYSSGTTAMLARLWQDAARSPAEALALPRARLFGPLGMAGAVLEPDASGTFVGSSYLYATARDWARFGQMLLQDGVWNGAQIVPADYVAWMREPAPASNGEYGRGHLWLHGPRSTRQDDLAAGMPADAFWILGHDGQSIALLPSQGLVVVRLGLTPSKLGYRPQPMVAALARLSGAD
jgi:CubicO group peptidase (beta-lactamase class C family)